jgi:hypothetical protein
MTAKPHKPRLFRWDSLATAILVGVMVAVWVRAKGEQALGSALFGVGAGAAAWLCEGVIRWGARRLVGTRAGDARGRLFVYFVCVWLIFGMGFVFAIRQILILRGTLHS